MTCHFMASKIVLWKVSFLSAVFFISIAVPGFLLVENSVPICRTTRFSPGTVVIRLNCVLHQCHAVFFVRASRAKHLLASLVCVCVSFLACWHHVLLSHGGGCNARSSDLESPDVAVDHYANVGRGTGQGLESSTWIASVST